MPNTIPPLLFFINTPAGGMIFRRKINPDCTLKGN